MSLESFKKLDIKIGKIRDAKPFPKAKKPAYQLSLEVLPDKSLIHSSAQITIHYKPPESLIGRLVVCITNFPPRIIAGFKSQALVTGFYDKNEAVVLSGPFSAKVGDIVVGSKVITFSDFIQNQIPEVQSASIEDFTACSISLGQLIGFEGDKIYLTDGIKKLACSGSLDASYLQKQILFLPLSEESAEILGIRVGGEFIPITVSCESSVENGSKLL
jgi:tRNA-binding protein